MKRSIAPLAALVFAAMETTAFAQIMTVQSLLNDGYTVVGINTSQAGGAGVFLQKRNALVYCYATETPTSPTLATQYCKPVK